MNDRVTTSLRARLLAARAARQLDALAAFSAAPLEALVELDAAEVSLLRALVLVRQLRQAATIVAQARALDAQREAEGAAVATGLCGRARRKGGHS